MSNGSPARPTKDGAVLAIRLTPRAAKDAVIGLAEGPDGCRLQVSVRAQPEKGAANSAAEACLARWLGLPRSQVRLAQGGKSRYKALLVSGEASALMSLIAEKLHDLQ